MIPIIVISLRRSVHRRRAMQEHLDAMGIPFAFFDAVDGDLLSPGEVAAVDPRPVRAKYGRMLSSGEIGLGASYQRVLSCVAAGSEPHVCVLEDDARLLPEAVYFLSETNLAGLPAFDILQLHPARRGRRFLSAPVSSTGLIRVYAPLQPSGVSVGQIFSRAGAGRLLRHLKPLRAPVDDLLYRDPAFGSRILETRPPVVGGARVGRVIGSTRGHEERVKRLEPAKVVVKAIAGVYRGARRWPLFLAAWGPGAVLHLRRTK